MARSESKLQRPISRGAADSGYCSSRSLSLAVVAFAGAASLWYCGSSHGDDTFIYLRYLQNFLNNGGLTFNVSEASYGVTSFAWVAVLLGPASLFGTSVWMAKLASLGVFLVFVLVLSRLLTHSHLPWFSGLVMVACLILEPHLLRWSSSGMENSLVALAALLLLAAWPAGLESPQYLFPWAVLCGVAPFVRPELSILVAALFLDWLLQEHFEFSKQFWRTLGICCLSFGLALFAVRYFTGAWLPQTVEAKKVALHQLDPMYAVKQVARIMASGALPVLALAIAALRDPGYRAILRPALAYVALVASYLAVQNQLVATRYSASLELPIVIAFAVAAIRVGRFPRFTLPILVLQLSLAVGVLAYMYPATRVDEGGRLREFSLSARDLTASSDRIALTEVGEFGYYSQRYIVDLVGLVDRESLEWLRTHERPRSMEELEAFLKARCATYYVEAFGGEVPLKGLSMQFQVVEERKVESSNFSAGSVKTNRWRLYRLGWPGCQRPSQ